MQFVKQSDLAIFANAVIEPGSNADYRARIAAQHAKILEQRRQELSEQNSKINTPAARIRIWERLHQVALPRAPTHKVLHVIAAHTGLSIQDVRDEQNQRLSGPKAEV